jgi:hypothetical protein
MYLSEHNDNEIISRGFIYIYEIKFVHPNVLPLLFYLKPSSTFSNDFGPFRANGISLIFVMYFDFRFVEYALIEKGVFTH